VARFWDTSAVVPLLEREPATADLLALLRDDQHMIVWWGTEVECLSALARRVREGGLDTAGEANARTALAVFADSWSEVQPTDRVRSWAKRLLTVHPLRAADALQLAAALVWSDGAPDQREFVCLDDRLREAARKEGFTLLPPD
jgi:predicted nucleic acid-binding protein